jgi:tetratricopeptide (TPR) repeat protein
MSDKVRVDMLKELFVAPTRSLLELKFPPKAVGDYLRILDSAADEIEKFKALDMLVECHRCGTIRNSGWFVGDECDQVINTILKHCSAEEDIWEGIGVMLVKEGLQSEKVNDFKSALKFFEASMRFGIYNKEFRYVRLNKLGYCLCFYGRFGIAEEYLRAATAMEPERYGAHKNLGVALEHQGKYLEAADSYRRAIDVSRGEPRCVRHYKRLLARRPELRDLCPPDIV